MTPDDKRHGTYAGANAHTKANEPLCQPCLDARRRYLRRRDKLRKMGQPGLLPLGIHHQRVTEARQRGMTYQNLADQIGVTLSTVHRWVNRGSAATLVPVATLRLLEAWKRDQAVTHIGCLRRLQALAWLGYPASIIATHAGVSAETIREALLGGRGRGSRWSVFQTATAEGIVRTYAELWNQPRYNDPDLDPHQRTAAVAARNEALRKGWCPPLAWDCIDDERERPKGVGTTRTDRADVLADVDSWGGNATDACRALGIDRDALQKWAGNHGCSEMYRRLAARETVQPNQYAKGDVA